MADLVVLDVDGTLTKVRSSWQYVHERLDIWQGKAEHYQESFRRGEISYREFCVLDGKLWEGIPVDRVVEIIGEIPYREGVDEFFNTLRNVTRKFALVSTGLSFLVDRVKDDFNLDFAFSNHLLSNGKYLTGKVEVEVDWGDKEKIVRYLKKQLGIPKDEVAIFGDSEGDIGMFEAGGVCIAVEPTSETLRRRAHLVLEDGDLKRGARHLLDREERKCTGI
jgi:phosphoserine phosphatase